MNVNSACVSPCKECISRSIGCHAICKKYLNWIDTQQKAKEKRITKGNIDTQFRESLRKTYPFKGKGASK